jgi:photosystem II stability/assembly factor-like uncharacterized protein
VVWVQVASNLLFRSTDRGTTWEQRTLPPRAGGGNPPVFSFVDADNGWYFVGGVPETQCNGAGAEIWRTTDGAANWQHITLVERTQPAHTDSGIAYAQCKDGLSFIDPLHGLLGAWDPNHRPTVYRTSDGGKTWSAGTLPDPPGFVSEAGGSMLRLRLVKGFGTTLLALADANRPPAYVFRSTDGGATWVYLATASGGSTYPAFVTASRWLVIGNDGSGLETTDAGKSWHSFSTDYADAAGVASTFVFGDGSVGYGTVRGGLQRTVDGGSHWIRIATPGTYTSSPGPSPTLSQGGTPPDPARLTSQKCSSAPATTPARQVEVRYTIRVPLGWADTGDYKRTESLLLELTAPASYENAPTRIRFHVLPYDIKAAWGPQATAHSIAADEVATHRFTSPGSVATAVVDCTVAGEPAAVFGYAEGAQIGYWLIFVHDKKLFGVRFFGTGGITDKAIQDALGMIGSIVWTS